MQYRGHFLQLKPQNKRYGPTQAKALVCEWEDGAVEVHYRGERMDYEDLVVRPQAAQAAPGEPHREPAKQVGSKPAQGHPWRQGYEQRMKLQRLNRSQESALLGVSAGAKPCAAVCAARLGRSAGGHPKDNIKSKEKGHF